MEFGAAVLTTLNYLEQNFLLSAGSSQTVFTDIRAGIEPVWEKAIGNKTQTNTADISCTKPGSSDYAYHLIV